MSRTETLFDGQGRRLYLTGDERDAFLKAAEKADRETRTFCSVLYYTGCRISEALALTPQRFDFPDKTILFETLKKRRTGVYRAVPVPAVLLDTLDMVHGLRELQRRQNAKELNTPLWPFSRTSAWRLVKSVMDRAEIQDGAHKMPKGLRHAYGIHALNSGIPLNLLSKWMGHSTMEITAIYANAVGQEQQNIAARMWS
jgi:integrase/recombinase XerD